MLIYLTISHLTIITNNTIIKSSSEQKTLKKIFYFFEYIIYHKSCQYQSYYDLITLETVLFKAFYRYLNLYFVALCERKDVTKHC